MPAIAFLISGGHTEIVLIEEIGLYKILGATRDDAIGEAFDKVARMLGLPYPGGPEISRLAKAAREEKTGGTIKLPRPMIDSNTLDMSFSGLKTAVLYELKKHAEITDGLKREIAREFEDSVTDVIIAKLRQAFDEHDANTLIQGGRRGRERSYTRRLRGILARSAAFRFCPLRPASRATMPS